MRIALASAPVATSDIEHNVAVIISTINSFGEKVDVVVFGESVLQGFDCMCWNYDKDIDTAVTVNDSCILEISDAAMNAGVAACFGYIEKLNDKFFSSQVFIGADGEVVHNFHRVSVGWKESFADDHYLEGERFELFSYGGKRFAIGLCGDLWTDGRAEEMKALNADIVLWPVWCDYNAELWNSKVKYEYADQAAKCGDNVLLVNPYCVDKCENDCAAGGAVQFRNGVICSESPSGSAGVLLVEV